MTTDPNRPSDPMPPSPNDPMPPDPNDPMSPSPNDPMSPNPNDPMSPSGPPPINPPSPPTTTPPPVGAGDPYAQASGSGASDQPPPAEGTGYGSPQSPPGSTGFTPQPSAGTGPTASSTAGRSGGSVSFNRANVSTYDMGLAAAAVLFLIAMILPWVSISFGPGFGSISAGGFDIGRLTFALILLIAAAAIALLPAFGVNLALPVQRSFILLGLTALAAIITLTAFIEILTSDGASSGVGAWLGMLVALGAVALAFLVFQAERQATTA